jgi:hypothetical protein
MPQDWPTGPCAERLRAFRYGEGAKALSWGDPKHLEREAFSQDFVDLYENPSYFESLKRDFKGKSRAKDLPTEHFLAPCRWWQFFHPSHPFSHLIYATGWGYRPHGYHNIPYWAGEWTRNPQDLKSRVQVIRMGMPLYSRNRIEPVFKSYLKAKHHHAVKKEGECAGSASQKYTHLYINNLKRSLKNSYSWYNPLRYLWAIYDFFIHFARNREAVRSKVLHAMEEEQELGIAVVSLPADCIWFLEGYDKKKGVFRSEGEQDSVKEHTLLNQLIGSIQENKNDFYLSERVKGELWDDNDARMKAECKALFRASLKSVLDRDGYDNNATLTARQRQAVLFDFIKYRFPKYLAERLQVFSMNMTCKDGIDRGGIGTTWLLLQEALEHGKELKQEEFMAHLYASALLVKGRITNDNRHIIWQALFTQYRYHSTLFIRAKIQWVPQWLKDNTPKDYAAADLEKMLLKRRKKRVARENDQYVQPHASTVRFQPDEEVGENPLVGKTVLGK